MVMECLHYDCHVRRLPLGESEDFIQIDEPDQEAANSYDVHTQGQEPDPAMVIRPEDILQLQETEDFGLGSDDERFALPRPRLPAQHALPFRHVNHVVHPDPTLVRAGFGQGYPNGGFGGVPASDAAIAGLEKRMYDGSGDDKECVICSQDYEVGDDLSMVPCSQRHRFHLSCLAKWLALSRLCPLCRHALPTKE